MNDICRNMKLIYLFLALFSDIGIVTANNGPIRLIDASSGETLVLCDRPDCRHIISNILIK